MQGQIAHASPLIPSPSAKCTTYLLSTPLQPHMENKYYIVFNLKTSLLLTSTLTHKTHISLHTIAHPHKQHVSATKLQFDTVIPHLDSEVHCDIIQALPQHILSQGHVTSLG